MWTSQSRSIFRNVFVLRTVARLSGEEKQVFVAQNVLASREVWVLAPTENFEIEKL